MTRAVTGIKYHGCQPVCVDSRINWRERALLPWAPGARPLTVVPLLQRLLKTYHAFPRQFWLIALGVLISSAGSSMIWPFQLIYVSRQLGVQISTVATLITLSSGTGLLVSFAGGSIADRVGRKPIMFAAQAAHGLAYILMSRSGSYLGFLVPMTIMAIAMPIYAVGSDAMMADMLPPEQRTEGYSILRMINNAGIAVGPAIGGFIVSTSYTLAFRLAACCMCLYGLMLLAFVRETLDPVHAQRERSHEEERVGGYNRVLKDRFFVMFVLVVALGMIAPLMMWTLLAVYTKLNFGLPEHLYSWIPITNALMCVFVQYFVTRVSRRYSPLPTLAVGMLIYAVGVGSVAWANAFPGFVVSMVVLTFGELILVPTGTTFVANRAPADLRGRYMSVYWVTWGLSRAVAPMIGGFLNDAISPRAVWHGGLIIGLASTCGLLLLARRIRTAPAAETCG
jgi:MFS family permease